MLSPPKVFISYCWSTPDHEQWVVDLGTMLMESGVNVILDKWDLREGHDAIAFMEQMVTDPSIDKVLIICDRQYATKADGRSGGVGTETQIITSEIYKKQAQDKFVAVIAERNDDDSAAVPTYYKSRIYIDLSRPESHASNFETLVRCVFDKPLHKKPSLGTPPSYIRDPDSISLPTSALSIRVNEAFKSDKRYSWGALEEYFEVFSSSLEKIRLAPTSANDDLVITSIEQFVPYRDELLAVVFTVSRYGSSPEIAPRLHSFLEGLLPYMTRPPEVTGWNDYAFDNYRFVIHELFLHVVRTLIQNNQFEACDTILGTPYVSPSEDGSSSQITTNFRAFFRDTPSLKFRNERLALKRTSLRSDLLEQRARSPKGQFSRLMEADFICFLRYENTRMDKYKMWWPETLLYTFNQYGPFQIFLRAASKSYLPKVLKLIGASGVDQLKNLIEDFNDQKRHVPQWNYDRLSVRMLVNLDELGSVP